MPIEPPEIPPATPGQPTEPPRESPPGNPRPEVPPPVREPGVPPRPDELPGKMPDEVPGRGPNGPSPSNPATDTAFERRQSGTSDMPQGTIWNFDLKPAPECVMNERACNPLRR